ncbi:ATP-dependent DNA helicase 2 subunit, putative [Pediculus humanus corporis]|uniref:ATP-dependent DNA helicase 2 subunit, putative n=1 Tax=Pediculus humanus subsp. corporis TaxID=121224 RepID=E0W023_PEDHC|nr:ATP-dependent DNA helicase 2 subunit, putative [Pediculus humanus corporis]EEB18979.1 ATP-dependent DNA helicase 2 subunit, putative [Pediculus humanus corporis]
MKKVFYDIENFEEEEEEEEEENNSSNRKKNKYQHKTGALLFLIDAREKMFKLQLTENKCAMLCCLESIRNTIRKKIFNEEKCYCGVMLLGTSQNNNPLNLDNIFIIQDFKLLGAKHILKIDEIIEDVKNFSYENKFGFESFSLGDAFWLSMHIFREKSQQLNKSILFLTNDDDGVTDQNNDYNRAMTSAKDMKKNHIFLDVIQLGESFDTDKFYSKLLKASQDNVNYVHSKPVSSLKEIENRMNKINFKHVTLVKLPFVIGEDFQIGISIHFLAKKVKLPFKVKLSKSTNERVYTKMQMFETETGTVVNDDDILKSQIVGQKEITFNLPELKMISESGKIELRLLGFKPASVITLENFIKPCAFIYPDDYTYKGSSVFFAAFLNRCIAKQVVPICTLCLRKTSACRFVALIGQNECSDSIVGRDLRQGFVVFFLPFAEEVRPYEDVSTKRAEPEQVEIAKKFIKKLKFKYNVECFQNPRLKAHWSAIEALALDLPEPEETNDSTYPNYELMSARAGDLAKRFTEAVYPNDYDPEIYGAPKKSKSSAGKSSKPGPAIDIKNVEELIKAGEASFSFIK